MNVAISDYVSGTLHIYRDVELPKTDEYTSSGEKFVLDKGFSLANVEWFSFLKTEEVSE